MTSAASPDDPARSADAPRAPGAARVALPPGVLVVRRGPGANCSSAGSAVDILFYGSVFVGAVAVALAAAFPPRDSDDDEDRPAEPKAEEQPR